MNNRTFIRTRILSFSIVLMFILRNSVKSLQIRLNELLIMDLKLGVTVSSSAIIQARAKFVHTAFKELNKKAVVDVMYSDKKVKLYKGMRVLGVDGSKIRLPDSEGIEAEFGGISYSNQYSEVSGSHCYGLASVLYDVLNDIAIDSIISDARAYEVDLAIEHLEYTNSNDLLIFDRNYTSYLMLSTLTDKGCNFVIRCSKSSFSCARKMLNGEGESSQVVTLKPHHSKIKEIRANNLPENIKVRFVRVLLDTGEYEVLVTSLIDEEEYPTADFKEIYFLRWGVETFFDILKNRLNLENFSGSTAESVRQDFYSSIYLMGLETILTLESNEELGKKETKYPQKVNNAIAFNAIKNRALELLYSSARSIEDLIKELDLLFLTSPTSVRKNRKVARKKTSSRRVVSYLKRKYKICF